jgi:hypothetical protein
MSLNISDPLSLLAYQSGLADPPLLEAAAQAADDLTSQQRAYKIGDPVPIVFCRRVSNNGGVMVSPGATEARYQNDGTTNALTVSLMVVLSEGDLPQIAIKDCFVGPCRQGTWNQTYDRRAGTWTPGNFVTTVSGKDPWACPYYCGTSGRYEDMTTMSYVNTFVDGSERWEHQLHVFVREGIQITRIIDSTLGPSNNVIDLAIYLMNQSGRIPSTLIDNTQMLAAANFTETNGLHFNGVFQESLNLDEWLEQISNDYLLRLVELNGKFGFKPRMPVNANHTIKTTAIGWSFTFTEDHLLPDGFEIQYIPLSERQPVTLQMMWRQQPDSDIGFARTTEISYTGEASAGPFEQYDLSGYCTSETHAVKVGAYRLARRKYITHTLRLNVRPASYNSTLTLGDIVRVRLRRETALAALDYHDFLYEVERIEKTASGACVFDLTHYPIDSQGRSLVALEVAAATAPGVTIAAGRSDYSCDDNSSSDNTPVGGGGIDYPAFDDTPDIGDATVDLPAPTEPTWPEGGSPPIGPDVTQPPGESSGGPTPIGGWDNPADPYEESLDQDGVGYITGGTGTGGAPRAGDTVSVSDDDFTCNGQVCWSKINKNTGVETDISCQDEPIAGSWDLSITTNEIDHYIVATGRCKDPSTSSGYGAPRTLGQTLAVLPNQCTSNVSVGWTKATITSAGCSGTCTPTGATTSGIVSASLPTVYQSYTQARFSAIAPTCGGPALGTYASYLNVKWIKIGSSYFNATTQTISSGVTDYIFAVFEISKDQTLGGFAMKKGDKIGLAVASGITGSVGCSYPQSNITSMTYNNTVSCT